MQIYLSLVVWILLLYKDLKLHSIFPFPVERKLATLNVLQGSDAITPSNYLKKEGRVQHQRSHWKSEVLPKQLGFTRWRV